MPKWRFALLAQPRLKQEVFQVQVNCIANYTKVRKCKTEKVRVSGHHAHKYNYWTIQLQFCRQAAVLHNIFFTELNLFCCV